MKAKRIKSTMQAPSVNGEQGKRKRTKPVRTHNQTKGRQKRKTVKGEATPSDELMPVVPLSNDPEPLEAASIAEFQDLCHKLEADYLKKISDFKFVAYEQLTLDEKRAERHRYLEVHRRLRAS